MSTVPVNARLARPRDRSSDRTHADPTLSSPGRSTSVQGPGSGCGAPAALCELAVLLEAAAHLQFDDAEAVGQFRLRAHRVTSALAVTGRIPWHLVVAPVEPIVVVLRSLAAVRARITACEAG